MTMTFRVKTRVGQVHQFNEKAFRVVKVKRLKEGWEVVVVRL